MKTTIKFMMLIIGIFVAAILTTGCITEEPPFSCDEAIDKWVNDNLSEIQSMDRKQWMQITNAEKGKAAYRAFSSNQRYYFWRDKLNEVLSLNWNETEKSHIRKLIIFITDNKEIFEEYKNNTNLQEKTDKFIYLWMETATEDLKWTPTMLYAMIASGEKMLDKTGKLEKKKTPKKTISATIPQCECSAESDWCFTSNVFPTTPSPDSDPFEQVGTIILPEEITLWYCRKGGCRSKAGCGTLWLNDCTGICTKHRNNP